MGRELFVSNNTTFQLELGESKETQNRQNNFILGFYYLPKTEKNKMGLALWHAKKRSMILTKKLFH